jgi:hypothetical protein
LEGIEDLWKFSFTDNGVLKFTYSLISENNITFVDTELEWKEENWNIDCLILTNLHNLKLAGIWLWYKRFFLTSFGS